MSKGPAFVGGANAIGGHPSGLLLKQILKRLPRIVGPLRLLARRLFLQPHTDRVERAVVALVFWRNSRRDRLIALKAA